MIRGIGNDIEEIRRLVVLQQQQPKIVSKLLTPAEVVAYEKLSKKRQGEYLTGRFSAKEAYSKALGTGIGKAVSFQELEILNDDLGRPYFTKHPLQDDCSAYVSISHTKEFVATVVVLETR